MPQIRPITDLRNTAEISDLCHSKPEPVFITKNGYGDMVIMSMETYERKMALADIYEKLAVAEKQIIKGELLNGEAVFAKLRAKHGN
ncbi:MAG: type II toxin-antitoxin system Phd/YefM family antitoxin [Acidobacteriota bacterium]|jgi:PHD/YefM family antitoxin component YafN of YafNO toxin-antitoxin module|nr:type II toxin-antitoxin system Phd/YefM family antitoxin [Acidobacteriota bacterium]